MNLLSALAPFQKPSTVFWQGMALWQVWLPDEEGAASCRILICDLQSPARSSRLQLLPAISANTTGKKKQSAEE